MPSKPNPTAKPDSGSTLSPQEEASAGAKPRDWTPEEMAAAQPLPIPTTEAHPTTHFQAATAAGRASPAGRPEGE